MTATDQTTVDVTKVREELHRLIDQLPAWEAVDALDHVRYLLSDEDTLTEEEMEEVRQGEEEIARGEYVTLDDIKARLAT
jgi:predicted transcriptional regulator